MLRYFAVVCSAVALGGCSTLSFSPPPVNLSKQVAVGDGALCPTFGTADLVNQSDLVQSALNTIENYILAYRCAEYSAANGRQGFQIPSYLATLTGLAAPVFGAGENVTIAAGIFGSSANSANSYWSPQEKAGIINSALDALLCMKTEAVGVEFIDTAGEPPASQNDDGDVVEVSAERRYYQLVTASLFQVERILATRLRTMGTYDPAGLVAEIEKLTEEKDAAPAEPEVTNPVSGVTGQNGDVDSAGDDEAPQGMDDQDGGTNIARDVETKTTSGKYKIAISTLKPRLQLCVVRAKM